MRTTSGPQGLGTSASGSGGRVRSIFLVGFMGAGKSSVGQALAHLLGWPFEDLDQRIQARENRTIEQIFRESGEPEFRRLEHEALRELLLGLGTSPRIVALGGGAFVQPQNAALLESAGLPTVFLDAPPEELFRRCLQEPGERPLRKDREQFQRLYEARRPHYLKAAMHCETSGKTVETVAVQIAQGLRLL